MRVHVLGICGTFMGSLALLAREMGHQVSGSDAGVYPPMSTQLSEQGIELFEGFDPAALQPHPDLVVIGNALSRGNPAVEYVLDEGLDYCSGPEWLARHVLGHRHVLAVSGTHGKTTTSAMLAWILEQAGLAPGYLIGGVMQDFAVSARLGRSPYFVVEADEYDSAFFDKRSKFIHYRPRTLVINNLEFDHADIFADLAAIQNQFHQLVRTVPAAGCIITPCRVQAVDDVLARGCWSRRQVFALAGDEGAGQADWRGEETADGFRVLGPDGDAYGTLRWRLSGRHNQRNALAAIAAARQAGVSVDQACAALDDFSGVKRRLEWLGEVAGIHVHDDFAHHPTAIEATLEAMAGRLDREAAGSAQRLIAVIEPRSRTMRMGTHGEALLKAGDQADHCVWFQPADSGIDLTSLVAASGAGRHAVFSDVERIIDHLVEFARPGDHIVLMSNGGFGGIQQRLPEALARLHRCRGQDA